MYIYVNIYIVIFQKRKEIRLASFSFSKKGIQMSKLGHKHLCLTQQIDVFGSSQRYPTASLKSGCLA